MNTQTIIASVIVLALFTWWNKATHPQRVSVFRALGELLIILAIVGIVIFGVCCGLDLI